MSTEVIQMSDKTEHEMVKEFHELMGLPALDSPQVPDAERVKLRINLLLEEVIEVIDALSGSPSRWVDKMVGRLHHAGRCIEEMSDEDFKDLDLPHFAKELCDVKYVVEGFAVEFGIPLDEAFEEVHSSNMSKVDDDGNVIYSDEGKVLKGENYRKADLSWIK